MVAKAKAILSKVSPIKKSIQKSKIAASSVENKYAHKFTKQEEAVLKKLSTPTKIQEFIDTLGYDGADAYFSVRSTLRTRKAHCMGGALIAACALERLGYGPPRVMGIDAENDDSHAIAVYQRNGYWGAVAKSNFTLIRSRDPVYRTIRELMMSYFSFYFNTKRQMSMTAYSGPFNVNKSGDSWKYAHGSIGEDLEAFDDEDITPWIPVRPPGMKQKHFGLASKHVLKAGLLGSNPAGLYKPKSP